jgi:uncharacterized membrane protein
LQIIRKTVRKYLLAGLLALIPVFLTVWVFLSLVTLTDKVLGFLPRAYRPEQLIGFPIPGLGLILSLIIIFLMGALIANVIGRSLLNTGERILKNIPLLRWFYFSTKQLLEAIFVQGHDSFRRAILVEYPRKGIYSIGFVTGEARGQLEDNVPETAYTVFVPTTPNPTSGYLIVVPETEAIPLNWSVDEAFRIIISAGVLMPGEEDLGDKAVLEMMSRREEAGTDQPEEDVE